MERPPTTVNRKPRRETVPRQRITVACKACRQRRAKCNGEAPCERCARLQLDCSYAEDPDGRSKAAAKRKHADLHQDQELLYSLLGTIRDSSDTEVSQIVALIRSNASVDEVRSAIRMQTSDLAGSGREPSPELATLRTQIDHLTDTSTDEGRDNRRKNILQIQRIADSPLHRVPASPWTKVTDDAELVSHLMSLWLKWDKPLNNFVNSSLLLADMQNGQEASHYCSPFLINSILAWACPMSNYDETKPNRGTPPQLMTDFIMEAKRHLEVEIVQGPTITMVQGLVFLFLATGSTLQESAIQYLVQATDMARSLGQSPIPASIVEDGDKATNYSQAVDLTCWGIFNLVSSAYVVILKPQSMEIPARPRPVINDPDLQEDVAETTQLQDKTLMVSYETSLMSMHCDTSVATSKMTQLLFDPEKRQYLSRATLEEKALEPYHLMMSHLDHDDTRFRLEESSPVSLYGYKIKLLSMSLTILMFLKQPADGANSEIQSMAKAESLSLALKVAKICDLYMHCYGTGTMTIIFSQCTSMALYVFFEQPDTSIYHSQIISLCICLRAISRRSLTSMAILRMVQLEAKKQGTILPAATDKLLHDFEKDSWSQRQTTTLVSPYPSTDNITFRKQDALDMGKFLEHMDNLEIVPADSNEQTETENVNNTSNNK